MKGNSTNTRPARLPRVTPLTAAERREDAKIRRAVASDPDTFIPTPAQWATAEIVLPQPKKAIALRVDPDILAFFKQGGPGYQTRMVGVLREYVRLSSRTPGAKRGRRSA
jgi:uncharacterized protein (DUF4415 family)